MTRAHPSIRALTSLLAAACVLVLQSTALAQSGGDLGAPTPGVAHGRVVVPPPAEAAQAPDPGVEQGVGEDIPPPPGEDNPPAGYQSNRYPSRPGAGRAQDSETVGFRMPSHMATRLRVLDADFTAVSARGGNALVDGILSMVTGGLAITLGLLIDNDLLKTYFLLYGGAGVVRGIIDIALMPDPSTPAIEFAHMPMRTLAEAQARLRYGEEQLESLSDQTRLVRVLDASLNIAIGVAVVPLYLGPNDFAIENYYDYFVLIGAGISVISGVIGLLSESDAERRWEAYAELRARVTRDRNDEEEVGEELVEAPTRFRLGAGPLPGGGGAVVLQRTF